MVCVPYNYFLELMFLLQLLSVHMNELWCVLHHNDPENGTMNNCCELKKNFLC